MGHRLAACRPIARLFGANLNRATLQFRHSFSPSRARFLVHPHRRESCCCSSVAWPPDELVQEEEAQRKATSPTLLAVTVEQAPGSLCASGRARKWRQHANGPLYHAGRSRCAGTSETRLGTKRAPPPREAWPVLTRQRFGRRLRRIRRSPRHDENSNFQPPPPPHCLVLGAGRRVQFFRQPVQLPPPPPTSPCACPIDSLEWAPESWRRPGRGEGRVARTTTRACCRRYISPAAGGRLCN